ncbi:hypothetical protein SEA_PANAMAXUS_54 [Mycobacterium phage Panamaxus]|uniref:Uncharacterized protein n=1 Tax=Mycobacterium phage Veracruz TaxID=2530154 RepID=A0A481VT39_9CAUD|nr:hypothetical protein KIP27_gp37 [Mycobacterium phage Veracruz]AIS73729.1 hypothetical protein PBI_QUINNKIRO_55 [Mycobacterium phage QuinnKiro]ALA11858.1 hypothetical protein SEA_TEXAGE_55 [Mycobacterium phage Texage]AOT24205.1 hypothetical protein SEA_TODACORO_56 [Mycobacterium phage Todacoro]AOT25558.1 hypothetical protein SEA_MARGO_56 [Mycobacterium phage Margo]AUX82352.1 hypothetical protein SEA_LAMBERT1_56 [Mycobacterium phage Lambert1]AVP42973.1 hypothetical protein SEA_PANAMAXUS_54 [
MTHVDPLTSHSEPEVDWDAIHDYVYEGDDTNE